MTTLTMDDLDTISKAFVKHYGVKGMRWGIRRNVAPGGRGSDREKPSPDAVNKHHQVARIKKSGIDALSNKELQDLNNRMNLEQNYKRLASSDVGKSRIKAGQGFVKEALNVGKTVNEVYNFINSPAGKAVKALLK